MKRILCFASLLLLITSVSCISTNGNSEGLDETVAPNAKSNEMQACARMGTPLNFNDQRILAFQKIVQLQILRIKALPMTEQSTQELAQVEAIRRRVSYPLLTSSLRPPVVTKVLRTEAKNLSEFLEKRKKIDAQAQSLLDEVNQHFLPLLENEEYWNCLEKQTDFQEDQPSLDKTE